MNYRFFTGTARYYSLHRPHCPQQLLHDLVTQSVGEHGRSMVDRGCGTGEVSLPLSGYFDGVTAIDIDPGMVDVAREKTAGQNVENVQRVVGPAEKLVLADASQDLIVAGSSFHWMDRELLSVRAYQALTDRGIFAIAGGGSDVWDIKCE
jgi:ubiquinone/menaquinone biosynthesis C-methylase UbiE